MTCGMILLCSSLTNQSSYLNSFLKIFLDPKWNQSVYQEHRMKSIQSTVRRLLLNIQILNIKQYQISLSLQQSTIQIDLFVGFVVGWGTEVEKSCRTNGRGPEVYSKCAYGSYLPDNDEPVKHFKRLYWGGKPQHKCKQLPFDFPYKRDEDDLCYKFYKTNHKIVWNTEVYKILFLIPKLFQFETINEVVLFHKNKSAEHRTCFNKQVPRRSFILKQNHDIEESVGWCGTCVYGAKENSKLLYLVRTSLNKLPFSQISFI